MNSSLLFILDVDTQRRLMHLFTIVSFAVDYIE